MHSSPDDHRRSQGRLEHAPGGYVEFADDGSILYLNATLADWLGFTAPELIGRKFESILTVANRIFLQTHFFPLLKLQGHVDEMFLHLQGRDEATLPVIASAHRRVIGGSACHACVFLPVRRRREYEEEILAAKRAAEDALRNNDLLRSARDELEQRTSELERRIREVEARNEELQRVSQVLAHDLREPVRKIALFADLLRGEIGATASGDAAEALRRIEGEAKQTEQLIAALRAYLDANPAPEVETVDLNEVAHQAAAAAAAKLGFTDWTLECDLLPRIVGYRSLLQTLLEHLFENAIKFRARHRPLQVTVHGRIIQENVYEATKGQYRYADFVQVDVTDNGAGFDPKYKDYIFRLLKKVDLSSPGLGIGLATCRKIVAAHYGTISADTSPEGTTITFRLPREQTLLAPPTAT